MINTPPVTAQPPSVKIQLSVMSARGWSPMFGHCYATMLQHIYTNGIIGFKLDELILDTTTGQSLLHAGRHDAVVSAMKKGCTHLLMIDDDMQFTPDLLDVFLARRVPVIAANCLRKRDNKKEATAIRLDGTFHEPNTRTDIEEALSVGTGIMLISLDAIRHMPYPYFSSPWVPEVNQHMGEDYFFCKKAREYGVKIYIDNLVSNASAHMGEFAFHWGNNYPLTDRHFADLSFIKASKEKPEVELVKQLIK